ncbi:unnamed protein product [Periconia digitata]|uniref:RING-type domain-containing protein n=1 Tax=Periconia digitata TaxID=1303443 RepID=A0A9W4UNM1_9PLEO|nr:unnamed protein product [Periconia digitata]
MGTGGDPPKKVLGERTSSAIIIILPCIFAIVLITALTTAYLSSQRRRRANDVDGKEQKKRLEKLESHIKAEPFLDWTSKEKKLESECSYSVNLCVICLDDFTDDSQVRALDCHHVFHQECLDTWFARWNEYCPLCHKPIIPGAKPARERRRTWDEPAPVAFII